MLRLSSIIILLVLVSCSINSGESELCFIGDSITSQWDLDYYFPGFITHKHAEGGVGIQALDNWDLSNCRDIPTVFLMGTNNIGKISANDTNAQTKRTSFINSLIPRLESIGANPLILLSILPRNREWKQDPSVNRNLDLLNAEIRDALDSSSIEFKYINVFNYFIDADYNIKKNLYKDGVHLTSEGYEILSKYVLQSL